VTIHLSGGTIELQGACDLEDAEKLLQYLIDSPQATVDWRACTAAHTAVVQVLLAARPTFRGPPKGDFLRQHIEPLVHRRNV
jgi:hypothetical protein